jgi:endonuclease/exonuclease/phosphatase family metal-dependent hydrolase
MRIVNWNIEWMNNWFVGRGEVAFRTDNPRQGITDVADLCRRVAGVVNTLDPDVLTIEEGPSDIREMELFTRTYLADGNGNSLFNVFGGIDGLCQKIYTLVKKGGELKHPQIAADALTLELQEPWESDVDGDYFIESYDFTRQPLIVEGTTEDGSTLKIVTLHTKSKYVHEGKAKWNNPDTRQQFIIAALKNRRRISSEAMRLRRYLNAVIEQDSDPFVIVTGDFNDGPGIDYFEKRYLTHNVTDILIGSTYYPNNLFSHAFLERVPESKRYTAIFDDYIDGIKGRRLLLDHILVSPALSSKIKDSGIAHQEYNAGIDPTASERQKYVSDHRPVSIDL